MPRRHNPFFTGREDILEDLHQRLTSDQTAALSQTAAISGLGGIGKTQTAVEYAYRHREAYQAVLWTQADTKTNLNNSYQAIADLLELPGRDDPEQVISAVKRWLETESGWLLVFD